jgi:hypothetical protein
LPNSQPYHCPKCYYEAATRLSLLRHIGQCHGLSNQIVAGNEINQKSDFKEDQDPHLSLFHIEAKYKTTKTIKLEAEKEDLAILSAAASVPKIKFQDFIKDLYGLQEQDLSVEAVKSSNVQIEKTKEIEEIKETSQKAVDLKLLANIHPPSRISILQVGMA